MLKVLQRIRLNKLLVNLENQIYIIGFPKKLILVVGWRHVGILIYMRLIHTFTIRKIANLIIHKKLLLLDVSI